MTDSAEKPAQASPDSAASPPARVPLEESPQVQALNQVMAESSAAMRSETAHQAPIKRGRGRPPKIHQASQVEAPTPQALPAVEIKPPMDWAPCVNGWVDGGNAWLKQTKYAPLKITDEEKGTVVPAAASLLQKWFPQLDESGISPELAFLLAVSGVLISKAIGAVEIYKCDTATPVQSDQASTPVPAAQ